jgi:hypothetical protein
MSNNERLVTGVLAILFGVGAGVYAQTGAAADHKLHIEGCVAPAGGGYVLKGVKVIAASQGVDDSPNRTFTLKQVDPERLKALSGKRADVSARVSGTDAAPELDVIAITESVGQCPAPPESGS